MRSSFSQIDIISSAQDAQLWKPLFQRWTEFVERYVNINNGGDAPYWYNERASLSLFTGAAWDLGYIALDEFGTQKVKGEPEDMGYGRCDAWISTETHEVSIEAKQLHHIVSANKMDVAGRQVSKYLKMAYTDATKLTYTDGARLGIAFCSPCFHESEWNSSSRDQLISSLISAIINENPNIDLIACSFPEQANSLTSDKGEFKGRVFPGTIAVAQFVK